MLCEFNELPDESRIWIYQANRSLTPEEVSLLHERLSSFLGQWAAHGQPLKAGYEIRYNRFIIIGVDSSFNQASGCSIDASVHFVQELERDLGIDLMDKMNVSYRQGDFIAYKPLSDFRKMAKEKAVSLNTIVFNNLVNNKEEYLNYWEVPARDSWHARFMN